MTKSDIKEFISNSTYSTTYLPIFDSFTNEVFAYEALSKFVIDNNEISCSDYFSKLYSFDKLFFFLEQKNKQHQIKNADFSKKLILYFDVIVFKKKEYREYWKEFLSLYRDKIIIGITPQINSHYDVELNQKLFKWLVKNDFEFMFSIFNDNLYTISYKDIERANYLKINKKIFSKLYKNNSYFELLNSIISFAHNNQTKTIIKHIETEEELNIVKKFKFDFIQKIDLK